MPDFLLSTFNWTHCTVTPYDQLVLRPQPAYTWWQRMQNWFHQRQSQWKVCFIWDLFLTSTEKMKEGSSLVWPNAEPSSATRNYSGRLLLLQCLFNFLKLICNSSNLGLCVGSLATFTQSRSRGFCWTLSLEFWAIPICNSNDQSIWVVIFSSKFLQALIFWELLALHCWRGRNYVLIKYIDINTNTRDCWPWQINKNLYCRIKQVYVLEYMEKLNDTIPPNTPAPMQQCVVIQ